MGFLTPLWTYVDALVHPSAQLDALTAARHRAFIAPRLIGSFTALASFPVYVAFRGVPSALEVGVFAWLAAPILIAYFLSRTGRYESAHMLSSLALTGLVTVVAAMTGGIASFAAIWLVVVPLEAALSASRRVVALASTVALGAAGLLLLLSAYDLLPRRPRSPVSTARSPRFGIISASLYAIGLALGAEQLARTGVWLLYAEEDRYHLLARNMTDVITRHGRNGTVLFVSPAAEQLFGVRAADAQRPRPVRPRPCRRPAGLSHRARRRSDACARTARSNSASAAMTASDERPVSSGWKCAAVRSTAMPTRARAANAKSSRCCATSANARRRSERSSSRARNPSVPMPPRAASSPP